MHSHGLAGITRERPKPTGTTRRSMVEQRSRLPDETFKGAGLEHWMGFTLCRVNKRPRRCDCVIDLSGDGVNQLFSHDISFQWIARAFVP